MHRPSLTYYIPREEKLAGRTHGFNLELRNEMASPCRWSEILAALMSKGAVSTVKPETVLRGHKDAVNCIGFLSDQTLSSGSADGIMKVWSLSSRRAVSSFEAHSGSVLSVNVLLHSSSLLTSGRDGFTRLWRVDRESSFADTNPFVSIHTGSRHFCNSSCDRGYLSGNCQ